MWQHGCGCIVVHTWVRLASMMIHPANPAASCSIQIISHAASCQQCKSLRECWSRLEAHFKTSRDDEKIASCRRPFVYLVEGYFVTGHCRHSLMDDWCDDDEHSDGLASAEARSIRSRFYNLGTEQLEATCWLFFLLFVHDIDKVKFHLAMLFRWHFSNISCQLQNFLLVCLQPTHSVRLFVTQNLRVHLVF
jgi:hypothetical protein